MNKDQSERYFTNYYVTYVKYDRDTDQYYLDLPIEVLMHLQWEDNEEVIFSRTEQNKITIKKKEK